MGKKLVYGRHSEEGCLGGSEGGDSEIRKRDLAKKRLEAVGG